MSKLWLLLPILGAVSACSAPIYRSQPCFNALSANFKPTLGAKVVDCGVIESDGQSRSSGKCAEAARLAHRPYWLGHYAWGGDGFMCWAAGEDADGRIWSWWIDRPLADRGFKLIVQRCSSLELRSGASNFEALGCADDVEAARTAVAKWKKTAKIRHEDQ